MRPQASAALTRSDTDPVPADALIPALGATVVPPPPAPADGGVQSGPVASPGAFTADTQETERPIRARKLLLIGLAVLLIGGGIAAGAVVLTSGSSKQGQGPGPTFPTTTTGPKPPIGSHTTISVTSARPDRVAVAGRTFGAQTTILKNGKPFTYARPTCPASLGGASFPGHPFAHAHGIVGCRWTRLPGNSAGKTLTRPPGGEGRQELGLVQGHGRAAAGARDLEAVFDEPATARCAVPGRLPRAAHRPRPCPRRPAEGERKLPHERRRRKAATRQSTAVVRRRSPPVQLVCPLQHRREAALDSRHRESTRRRRCVPGRRRNRRSPAPHHAGRRRGWHYLDATDDAAATADGLPAELPAAQLSTAGSRHLASPPCCRSYAGRPVKLIVLVNPFAFTVIENAICWPRAE